MIVQLENDALLQGMLEGCLRSSLEPVPVSFECRIRLHENHAPYLLEDKIIRVQKTPMRIVFVQDSVAPFHQGELVMVRHIIALHHNSASVAQGLSRAVIREQVSLSEIYRACGGQAQVDKDFIVPRFYAYRGNVPSHLISRVCQEQGGVVRWLSENNRLAFTRIHDLFAQQARAIKPKHADHTLKSGFISKQEVAQYVSTDANGLFIKGQNAETHSVVYTPNKTQAQLNAMANVILNAKEMPCDYAPNVHAGEVVQMGDVKMVIITAAHYHKNDANQSVFWLGVKGH